MRQLFFYAYLFFFTTILSAQNDDFEKGLIYLKDGTTQEGYIQRNTLQQNGQSIPFKKNLSEKANKLKPSDLTGFQFLKDGTTFKNVIINYYQVINGKSEKTGKIERFAQKLITGAVSLYKAPLLPLEYDSNVYGSKDFLYLIQNGEAFTQIDILKSKAQGNTLIVSKNYRGVLGYALKACDNIREMVKNVDFSDRSITSLIEKYHDCIGQTDDLEVAKESQPNIVHHKLRAGYLIIRDDYLEEKAAFNIGYQGIIQMPSLSKRLGLSIGADFTRQSYFWNDPIFYVGEFKESNLKLNLGLDYYFFKKEDFKIILTPGFSYFLLLSESPSILPEGTGSFQLLSLELTAQFKNYGIYFQTIAPMGNSILRPDGYFNIGVLYQLK